MWLSAWFQCNIFCVLYSAGKQKELSCSQILEALLMLLEALGETKAQVHLIIINDGSGYSPCAYIAYNDCNQSHQQSNAFHSL